jgi:hypothetical protein
MAVRPFLTTGIALASAGLLVAVTPVIAPPLTPRDVQVVTEVQNTSVISAFIEGGSLQAALVALAGEDNDIVNAFIAGGSLQALLVALGGGDPVVDGFIAGGSLQAGIVALAGCTTPDCGDDPDTPVDESVPVANAFIEGGTLQAALVAVAGDDNEVVNAFIAGGTLQAALVALGGGDPVVDAFIEGGALQAAIVALAACATPDCAAVEDDPATPEDESVPGNPVANGFIQGGTLQAALTALDTATSGADTATVEEDGTAEAAQILTTADTLQTGVAGLADLSNNGTAGLAGARRPVDSPVFGGVPTAAPNLAAAIAPPALPEPAAAIVRNPVAPVADVARGTDQGVDDQDGRLVRDSLSFKPEPIIPFGGKSDDDAGGPGLFDAIRSFTDRGQSEGPADAGAGGLGRRN